METVFSKLTLSPNQSNSEVYQTGYPIMQVYIACVPDLFQNKQKIMETVFFQT